MALFSQNVVFASVDLGIIYQKSKSLTGELMSSVMNLMSHNHFRVPQPLHIYKSSELEKAFRYLQSGKNTGKTIVEMLGDDIVPVCFTIVKIACRELMIFFRDFRLYRALSQHIVSMKMLPTLSQEVWGALDEASRGG